MPLVSGVCRTASAPMLSHGGSRLNASKPEANPKTRYPTQLTTSQHTVFRRGTSGTLTVEIFVIRKTKLGIAKEASKTSFPCLVGNSLKKFSIESPLKPLPPARPRWRQVFSKSQEITTPSVSHSNGFPDQCLSQTDGLFQSGEGKQHTPYLTSLSKRENMHWLA
jgi:hypothetical protein